MQLCSASAVLAVVILSVRLSRVLCDKTKQCTAGILISHERAITLHCVSKKRHPFTFAKTWL